MKSLFLLLLCTQILGNPILRDPASDEYIDQVLESLRALIAQEGLDPAQLPDGDASFSETILGITFHGSARVYNGFFQGLSTLHRNGDTSFNFDVVNNKLSLSANIGINDAKAGYAASAEFMDIGISASADAKIQTVKVYFEAEMCLSSGCSLALTKFDITEIGHIDVDINGLGPLGWILEVVVDLIADLIRGFLADILEGPIKDLLQNILNDLVPDIPSILIKNLA